LDVHSSDQVTDQAKGPKPKLRGVSHLISAVVAVPFVYSFMSGVSKDSLSTAIGVYGVCLVLLFAVSALYHVPMWSPDVRAKLRRLDRSMIYVFVAGTYTPMVASLEGHVSSWVLPAAWSAAGIGIAMTILFSNLPRYITAAPYVVLGWGAIVIMPAVMTQFGPVIFWQIAGGGVAYTFGAVVYAKRYPNPWPTVFGYHEIFHLLVIMAAASHFVAIRAAVS